MALKHTVKITSQTFTSNSSAFFDPVVHIPPIKVRQPDGSITVKAGQPVILNGEDEINSAEAARILGCEIDWVGKLCERGSLVEGEDWRRIGERGNYKIKRASILRLAGCDIAETEATPAPAGKR